MQKRVLVTIANRDYPLLTEDDAGYVERCAEYVDKKLATAMTEGKLSLTDAAILTAANLADEYYKAAESAENLRRQLKEYLEEAARLKAENNDLRREIHQLKNR